MAFGYWKWLKEAHVFPTAVISSMAQVTACKVSLRIAPQLVPEIPLFHT